jgi:fructuronate reductase
MKLRMLNGSHSALAYLGATAGLQTIDRAVGVPALRNYVDAMMRREIAPTLPVSAGLDPTLYAERLLARFADPALRHRTHQIAMDGSQKLPQRLLDSVRDRLAADAPIDRLALAIAGWIRFLRGVDEQGDVHPIDDPLRDALAVLLAQADAAAGTAGGDAAAERRRIDTVCRFAPVFGALGEDPRFVDAVARQAFSLRTRGVLASVERAIG